MLIVMLILSLITFYIAALIRKKNGYDYNALEEALAFFGILGSVISIGTIIVLGILILNVQRNDERIAVLIEQNELIEARVTTTVLAYLDHESDIYASILNSPDTVDVLLLVTTMPTLSSNVLVQREIDLYISNNNKIRDYRLESVNLKTYRWLIHFDLI